MAYFENLTPYSYFPGEKNTVNVGWLSKSHEFPRGPVSERFADSLAMLMRTPCCSTLGWHICEMCLPPKDVIEVDPDYISVWRMNRRGDAEVRVKGEDDIVYAAPTLIWHYIMEHQYQPPPQFVEAVIFAVENPVSQPNWEE